MNNCSCGVKELSNPGPLYTKPKAHVEEEETPKDEQRKSKLPRDIATNQDHKKEERHAIKGSLPGYPRKMTNIVGQPWEHGGGAIPGETVTSALNAHN